MRPHGARELAQPEPGFYLAGMKSYGRAPTFLMLTGYEQVRSIVAEIAGDHEAAAKVELVLPETGVCSGPGPTVALTEAEAAAGCCGGPAPEPASGCCVADVKAKARRQAELLRVDLRKWRSIEVGSPPSSSSARRKPLAWASSYYLSGRAGRRDRARHRRVDQLAVRHLLRAR